MEKDVQRIYKGIQGIQYDKGMNMGKQNIKGYAGYTV